jgi:hypothetical protein
MRRRIDERAVLPNETVRFANDSPRDCFRNVTVRVVFPSCKPVGICFSATDHGENVPAHVAAIWPAGIVQARVELARPQR